MITKDYYNNLTQRYFLFHIENYDCVGGLGDVIASCDTLEEAEEMYKECVLVDYVDTYVWDNKTRTIVFGNKTR